MKVKAAAVSDDMSSISEPGDAGSCCKPCPKKRKPKPKKRPMKPKCTPCKKRKTVDPIQKMIKKLNREITNLKKQRKLYQAMYKENKCQEAKKKAEARSCKSKK